MLSDILKSLRKPAARSSEELRGDLAKIDMPALEAAVDDCEARRRNLLLIGTDAEIEAATRDLAAANLAAERAEAAIAELNRQIAEAVERETIAEIEARAKAAKEAQLASLRSPAAHSPQNRIFLCAIAYRSGVIRCRLH